MSGRKSLIVHGVSFLANFLKLGMKSAYLCSHLDINAVVSVMIFSAECGHDDILHTKSRIF